MPEGKRSIILGNCILSIIILVTASIEYQQTYDLWRCIKRFKQMHSYTYAFFYWYQGLVNAKFISVPCENYLRFIFILSTEQTFIVMHLLSSGYKS